MKTHRSSILCGLTAAGLSMVLLPGCSRESNRSEGQSKSGLIPVHSETVVAAPMAIAEPAPAVAIPVIARPAVDAVPVSLNKGLRGASAELSSRQPDMSHDLGSPADRHTSASTVDRESTDSGVSAHPSPTVVVSKPAVQMPEPLPVVMAPVAPASGLGDLAIKRMADLAEDYMRVTEDTAVKTLVESQSPGSDSANTANAEKPVTPEEVREAARQMSDELFGALYGSDAYQSRLLEAVRLDYQQAVKQDAEVH